MAHMSTTVEIDQAGRLVVPKKLRDALHLLPGTRVSLRLQGESIVLKPDMTSANAYQKKGLWVYHASDSVSADDIRHYLEQGRNDREMNVFREVPSK